MHHPQAVVIGSSLQGDLLLNLLLLRLSQPPESHGLTYFAAWTVAEHPPGTCPMVHVNVCMNKSGVAAPTDDVSAMWSYPKELLELPGSRLAAWSGFNANALETADSRLIKYLQHGFRSGVATMMISQ